MDRTGHRIDRLARVALCVAVGLLLAGAAPPARAGSLSEEQRQQLAASRYVYIATQRKDGSFGAPAEIWFLFHDGDLWVGTTPQSWRARRIRAGRPRARIAIGKPDGPSFLARGEIVKDAKVEELLMATFATKYPDGWPRYEQRFRAGFADGSRILVRYRPE